MHVIFMGMFVMMIVLRVFMLMFVVVLVNLMFVFMFMHVFIFFHTMNNDMRVCAFDTALDALFEFICDIRNANGIKLFLTGFNVARKLG